MNAGLFIAITFILILLFLLGGMWISAGIGIVGILLYISSIGMRPLGMLGLMQFNTVNSFVFTCLPLFIFMGSIILESGIAVRLYKGASPWVSFLPGGLLHTNIVACAFFAAVSGSSPATAATIGSVAIPELVKRNYNMKLLLGSLAAGGTLGILIPPSITMIVYGTFVEVSIAKLFMAGLFPGLILAGLFMTWIIVASVIRPRIVPQRTKPSLRAMAFSIPDLLPIVTLILLVLGTIYLGVATPTESAALGAFGALVFSVFYRRFNWQMLKTATASAIRITCFILLIIIGAHIVGGALAYLRIPGQLVQWIATLPVGRMGIFATIAVFYLIMGCFVEGIAMILLTIPVVYPLMLSLGFDPVWFGVMIVVVCEMGLITPPVATNIYVILGIAGERHFKDLVIGIIPFLICMLVLLSLLYAFPNLALWLPAQMIKGW